MKSWHFILPLAVFAVLAGFLFSGLHHDPREVPSPLLGKPAPAFRMPLLDHPEAEFSTASMQGKVWLLNVWGSWCITCREEHSTLLRLAKLNALPIVGLDWRDTPADAQAWLASLGNPYAITAVDVKGGVAIDYGVYGAPESFLIDKNGIIVHKTTGAITDDEIRDNLLPLIKKLNQ